MIIKYIGNLRNGRVILKLVDRNWFYAYNWFNEQKPKRFLAKAVPASISFLKVERERIL